MPSLYALFHWPLAKIRESVATGAKGQERRADIVLEVPLLNSNFHIITIILEHKSYRDSNTVLQMLGYYNEIAQESGRALSKGAQRGRTEGKRDVVERMPARGVPVAIEFAIFYS